MNAEIRIVVRDIKAAARIGHAESLWLALDELLELPQAAGNRQLSAAFLKDAVLPAGQALAHPRLEAALVKSLGKAPHAVVRAACGAGLAYRYFDNEDVKRKDLLRLARDDRRDVRQSLALALIEAAGDQQERLLDLLHTWIADPSPRVQIVAMALVSVFPEKAVEILSQLTPGGEREIRAAMAEALNLASNSGRSDEVLELLASWAQEGENYVWVICKTLSSSWAAERVQETLAILKQLVGAASAEKQVKKVLKAMVRHGAGDAMQQELEGYSDSGERKLINLYQEIE